MTKSLDGDILYTLHSNKNLNPKNIFMNVYEANRSGLNLSQTEIENVIPSPSLTNRGYLSNQELRDLVDITRHTECVGIRIYNSCNPDRISVNFNSKSTRIVAVGVKKDGYELTDKYLVSNDCDRSGNHIAAQIISDRSLAKTQLNATFKALSGSDQYSSFFSREDILKLTDFNLPFTGVAFHFVKISKIDSQRLESRIQRIKGGVITHFAVPTNLRDSSFRSLEGSIIHFDAANAPINVLSDRACFGHCPSVTNVEDVNNGTAAPIVEIAHSPATGLNFNNDPYIVKWE